MDLNLKGKKAFVAGGSRGMGKAIAKVFHWKFIGNKFQHFHRQLCRIDSFRNVENSHEKLIIFIENSRKAIAKVFHWKRIGK